MNKIFKEKRVAGQNGFMLVLVLVFSAIFVVVLSALVGFVFTQNRVQNVKEEQGRAFEIAEAGLDYYQWFLAHYPNDVYDGQGSTSTGPYEHEYSDPEGGPIGKFSLDISGNTVCGEITSIDIKSTGWTYDDSSQTKTVYGRYSRPYLTEFAYITDENIWFGVGEDVVGRLHSNGGIRMDGENDSLTTSEQITWACPGYLGCGGEQRPGIFGTGGGWPLWRFPDDNINFLGMVTSFSDLKTYANNNNTYLPLSTDYTPAGKGYWLTFNNDGTITARVVTDTSSLKSWYIDPATHTWNTRYLDHKIEDHESYLPKPTITPVSGCSVVFVEDRVWVEGDVNGKVTLVVAEIGGGPKETVLLNNISYVHNDGTDGLLLMSQGNISTPWYSPEDLELDGIFISQSGRFGRDYYNQGGINKVKGILTLFGSVINAHTGTNAYIDWSGTVTSGYQSTINTYDRNLLEDPPPMTPYSSTQHRLIEWREE